MPEPQLLSVTLSDGQTGLAVKGAWTVRNADRIAGQISALPSSAGGSGRIVIDARGITEFDTYGAWLLGHIEQRLTTTAHDVVLHDLPTKFTELREVVKLASPGPLKVKQRPFDVNAWLASVGQATESVSKDALGLLGMLGHLGRAVMTSVVHAPTFRLTSTVHQLDRAGWQAIPIILLITFLIGCIIAQQGFFHFRKFGADQYVVDMVGILIVREIGVLLVAIMVAGRSGSSYTAELGSMKMREEIDALRTMGLDPISVLVLPRVLALIIAVPALTLIGSLAALYGGGLVAWAYGDMSPEIYIARLREAISTDHFKVGLLKAPFMAVVIGVVACFEGMQVKGSAASLGLHTTSSVVKSIFLVIVLDGLFAIYFASIGL